ncbi:MAG: calcium-binding protein [Methylococcus sp.]
MTTQVGSQGIVTANTGGAATTAAVGNYFNERGWTSQDLIPVNQPAIKSGYTTFVDDKDGTIVTTVGVNYTKGVFKIKDINQGQTDEILIGTGANTKVTGTDQGNNVTIIDDANHLVKLGKGDDLITNLGSGGGTFRGGEGSDTMIGGSGSEIMYGGMGKDVLQGGGGSDNLFGGKGADVVSGGDGDDFMKGGYGKDVLTGGAGNDVMKGGQGKDTFVFGSEHTGQDIITDFKKGDTLNLLGKQQAGIKFTVQQEGENTVVVFNDGSGDKITLVNVDADKLQDPDGDGFFNI